MRLAELSSIAGAEANAQISAEVAQIKATANSLRRQRLSSFESSLMAEIASRNERIQALSAQYCSEYAVLQQSAQNYYEEACSLRQAKTWGLQKPSKKVC